jgi:hypothetical protein
LTELAVVEFISVLNQQQLEQIESSLNNYVSLDLNSPDNTLVLDQYDIQTQEETSQNTSDLFDTDLSKTNSI